MRRTTLLLLLVTACASQADSASSDDPEAGSSTHDPASGPGATAACGAAELGDCVEDDDVAACTRSAIKHEYEMLEARAQHDADAFRCHQGTLVVVLDHACTLGDDQACAQAPRARSTDAPR